MDSHLITYKKLQEQSTASLIKCIKYIFGFKKYEIINCTIDNPINVYKEIFKRLAKPFYLPVLILISLFLILTSKENLRYRKNKFFIFFLGFGTIILSESSIGYITNNLIKNISILLIPLILALIFYLFFIYKLNLVYRKL